VTNERTNERKTYQHLPGTAAAAAAAAAAEVSGSRRALRSTTRKRVGSLTSYSVM